MKHERTASFETASKNSVVDLSNHSYNNMFRGWVILCQKIRKAALFTETC